jgi:hypothetical protein
MKNKDQILLEQLYSKVLKEEMGYPTDWNKGFQEPLRIAAGGTEVPFQRDGKWYLRVWDSEKGHHLIYSYGDDLLYPEEDFPDLPERPELSHDQNFNPKSVEWKKKWMS